MRLTSKLGSAIRKAAKRVGGGSAIVRCELASRVVEVEGRPIVTNLMDVDIDRTDLFDKGLFGRARIEDSKEHPGCAILEIWTYDRDELVDTVYVGIAKGEVVPVASARYELVKQSVLDAESKS